MKVSEHVRATITPDGAVLMNIKGGHMLTLNPTGSIIWQQLSDGRSPAQIAGRLASDFGISPEQALADVNAFLEQLEAQHLIGPTEPEGFRVNLGARLSGLFCNLLGERNSPAAQDRGSK